MLRKIYLLMNLIFFSSDALKGVCFVDSGRLFLHTSPSIPFAKASFHVLSCSRAGARGRLSGLKGKVFKTFVTNLCSRRTGQRKCLPG